MKQVLNQSTQQTNTSTRCEGGAIRTLSADEVLSVAGGEISVDEYPLPKR